MEFVFIALKIEIVLLLSCNKDIISLLVREARWPHG